MTQPHHARRVPTRWLRIGIPVLLVLVWLAAGSIGGPYFGKVDEVSSNDRSTFLPQSADATQVNERLADFLGDESIPAVIVVTGDGELTTQWQAYFADNLKRLTAGDLAQPLVFYCRSDCWLSWNAVKRAATLGYKTVYWYRDGLDAWQAANLPVTQALPEPFP